MRKLEELNGDGELAAEAMEEGALLGDYSGEEGDGDEGLADTGPRRSLRPGVAIRRVSGSSST
jgi:hypothetical protein